MIVRELLTLLGFKADPSGAKAYEDRLKETQRRAETTTNAMARGWTRVGRAIDVGLDRADRGLGVMQSHVQGVADSLGGLAGALGGALGFAGFAELTSRMTDFQSRLENAVEGTGVVADQLRKRLLQAANDTRTSMDQTTDAFLQMKPALSEMGVELDAQVNLLTAMSDAMRVGGITGEKAATAFMWLNRSLSTGKMSGEAFTGLMESADDVLVGLQKSLGLTTAEFQELGRGGKITSQMLVDYFRQNGPELRRKAAEMPTTIAGAFTVLRNSVEDYIFYADKAAGASSRFAKAIMWFAERPAILGSAAIGALALGLAAMAAQALATTITVVQGAVKMIKWLRALRTAQIAAALTNPWLLLAAAIAAVGIAVQDAYVWMKGGESVIGRWLGPWSEFAARISAEWDAAWTNVKAGFANISDAWSDLMGAFSNAANAIGDWLSPILDPVTAAIDAVFGGGGTLSTAILAAFPVAIALALWEKLWGALPQTVRDRVQGIFAPLEAAWDSAVGFLQEKWDGFWGGVGSAISGIATRIGNAFSGAAAEGQQYSPDAMAARHRAATGQQSPIGPDGSLQPVIPQYARGTPSAATGVALVGEEGPELVRFRGGEEVVPADRTQGILGRLAARANDFVDRIADFGPGLAAGLAAGVSPFVMGQMADFAVAGQVAPPALSRGAGGITIGTINAPSSVTIERGAIPAGLSEERVAQLVTDKMSRVARQVLASELSSAQSHFANPEA